MNKSAIEEILDLARWAPSGDNTQPWRFEILSDRHLVVLGFDTRHEVVYDLRGFASQMAIGALLELLSIAAGARQLKAVIRYRMSPESPSMDSDNEHPVFDVFFEDAPDQTVDPLYDFIKTRSVYRRPLGSDPLTPREKEAISHDLTLLPWPHESTDRLTYNVLWLEGHGNRLAMARITQQAGKLRLTIPEAFPVHQKIIEWNARYSEDRVPDQALGLSRSILPLMHWIMGSWERVSFFNRFLWGTAIPRIQLDILPALFCSAHFVLLAPAPPQGLKDQITAGRALCRLWLSVTRAGLQFQPEMTPLIFRSYARSQTPLSLLPTAGHSAEAIGSALDRLVGAETMDRAVYLGRVGRGNPAESRSLRLPVSKLLLQKPAQSTP